MTKLPRTLRRDLGGPAALAAVVPELLDLAEQPLDIAGVLAQKQPLELQRIVFRGEVTHFAVAAHALIGIDTNI